MNGRTPPRFRALIWSMVWSLLLDADCVNPLDPATGFCASLRHLEVVLDGIEANVRCAIRMCFRGLELRLQRVYMGQTWLECVLFEWRFDANRQLTSSRDSKCEPVRTDSHDLTTHHGRRSDQLHDIFNFDELGPLE
jgi:hypothetical protein